MAGRSGGDVWDVKREPIVDDAPGTPDGIPSLWAWVAIDAMGGEGIIGAQLPGLGAVALVTGSESLARGHFALAVAQLPRMGRRFELRRYDLAGPA
ncbi:MAG TPA: hypothetical protein VK611_21485 [Acidimicrobiales bacterium]|nr:hypothetical protein [Acidimicrobiales bacterium]